MTHFEYTEDMQDQIGSIRQFNDESSLEKIANRYVYKYNDLNILANIIKYSFYLSIRNKFLTGKACGEQHGEGCKPILAQQEGIVVRILQYTI